MRRRTSSTESCLICTGAPSTQSACTSYIHLYVNKYICIHIPRIYIHIYIYTYINMHTYVYMHVHIYIFKHMYMHIRICIHINIYIYMMLQVLLDQTEVLVPFVGRACTNLTWVPRHAPRNIFLYTNMREERDCKICESAEEKGDLSMRICT